MFFKKVLSKRCREKHLNGENEKHDLKTSHLEHLRKILITFHFVLHSDATLLHVHTPGMPLSSSSPLNIPRFISFL